MRKEAYNLREAALFNADSTLSRTMTNIAKILPLTNVLLNLDASSKKRAFEQAGLLFENNCGIARSTVFENLFARERLGSTGLGHGVAIPHGRISGLKKPIAAFIRLAEPIPFESPDNEPVHLLIFLLMPDTVTKQHLAILAEVAEMFSDNAVRTALSTTGDAIAVHNLILSWHPQIAA